VKLVRSSFSNRNDVINLKGDLVLVATAHQAAIPVSGKYLHTEVLRKWAALRHIDG
jgi:hypothetical protein